MNDVSDVGPVDAHAERFGRNDHIDFTVSEQFLDVLPAPRIKAAVVGACDHPGLLHLSCDLLGERHGRHVDDGCLGSSLRGGEDAHEVT